MIVNKEIRDHKMPDGTVQRELIASYVNNEHCISFMRYPIPESEMFVWRYTNNDGLSPYGADPLWKSYDNKRVKRQPCTSLNDSRVSEILCGLGDAVEPIYDMNIPETWFCDIEVDVDSTGFPKPDVAKNPINTIAITKFPKTIVFGRKPLPDSEINKIREKLKNYHPLTKDYVFEYWDYQDELPMLKDFIAFIKPIVSLSGWNFIGYDWLYIYNRCRKLNIYITDLAPTGKWYDFKMTNEAKHIKINVPVPMHKIISDYMIIYILYDQSVAVKENNTLDFVSEKVLGVKKVQHNMGFEEFYRDYYTDYVFYNAVDTILVEQIDKKLKTANVWYSISSELRTELNETFSTIAPTQTVMTYFLYPENKVLPMVKKNDKDSSDDVKYQGAFVWPSRAGVYKSIGGLDFESLYPKTMIQFNISPESIVPGKNLRDPVTGKLVDDYMKYLEPDECVTASGAVFKKDKVYLIPRILKTFFAKRKEAKKMKKMVDSEHKILKHILETRMSPPNN